MRALEESGLVEVRVEEDALELLHGVARVLGLDAVVPGEEGDLEAGEPGRLDVQQAVLQLLPEAGGGPVLDGEAGALGDPIVLVAVEALELVAEVQRVIPPVAALAQVVEPQPQRLADGQQPLEVGGAEAEEAAVDGALGADQVGVAFAVLGLVVRIGPRRGLLAVGPPVDHAQLVHQDFLGRPRLLERRCVDHPQQGSDEELIREDRELPDEMGELGVGRHAVAEPSRVGVVRDDAVVEQVALHPVEEFAEGIELLLGQFAAAEPLLDPGRNELVMRGRRHETPPGVVG